MLFFVVEKMSEEIVLCGKLTVIMKCGYRMHYDDFVQQTVPQVFVLEFSKGIKKFFYFVKHTFGKKYIIAPENFADMVYNWVRLSGEGQEKASEKTEKFLNMIQNPDRRIYYAEKFQNYNVAIDVRDLIR